MMPESSSNTAPYKVSTEEVKRSLSWLDNAEDGEECHAHSYVGGQRSEVREGRFNEHMIPEIIDNDVVSKHKKALALNLHKRSN